MFFQPDPLNFAPSSFRLIPTLPAPMDVERKQPQLERTHLPGVPTCLTEGRAPATGNNVSMLSYHDSNSYIAYGTHYKVTYVMTSYF